MLPRSGEIGPHTAYLLGLGGSLTLTLQGGTENTLRVEATIGRLRVLRDVTPAVSRAWTVNLNEQAEEVAATIVADVHKAAGGKIENIAKALHGGALSDQPDQEP